MMIKVYEETIHRKYMYNTVCTMCTRDLYADKGM